MSHLTFEAFCAAARHSSDLSQDAEASVRDQYDPANFDDNGVPAGFVYPCGLVIEDWEHAPISPEGAGGAFRFYLQLGNLEYVAHEREVLESQLFEYYVSECAG